jgi:polyhydroxyalkanoate synthase
VAPEAWQAQAPQHEGSWWTAWQAWLVAHGSGEVPARKPHIDATLGAAPGSYVHQCYRD